MCDLVHIQFHLFIGEGMQDLPVSQVDMYETPNNCAIYRP